MRFEQVPKPQDRSLGQGTHFKVYLPVIDAVAVSVSQREAALPHGDGQTVLLVDDEEALVALGEEVLAELGYEPVGFVSSEAAWQAFNGNPQRFDAVITDQTMPGITGLELATRIRAARPDVPVILASGYSNAALERDAKAADIADVLRKPLRQADLAWAMSRALSQRNNETAGRWDRRPRRGRALTQPVEREPAYSRHLCAHHRQHSPRWLQM
jgi:DNA-binding NtrC family response regulator